VLKKGKTLQKKSKALKKAKSAKRLDNIALFFLRIAEYQTRTQNSVAVSEDFTPIQASSS
jgi:hypothetical protein